MTTGTPAASNAAKAGIGSGINEHLIAQPGLNA